MIGHNELYILEMLRKNSRSRISDIARETKTPRSTVYKKIRAMERTGTIKKYSCLLDFDKLGFFRSEVFFVVNSDAKKLEAELVLSKHTNNVARLSNKNSWLVSFVFESPAGFYSYLEDLASKFDIANCHIIYVANEIKREGNIIVGENRHTDGKSS